jgi:H+/Cl- antiporter ClcA
MYALGSRLLPVLPVAAWVGISTSGMIGAMFGTPVAAALVLSETPGDAHAPLWDRLFAPLVAAGAGALTTDLLSHGSFSFSVPVQPYPGPQLVDLLTGTIITSAAALIGLGGVYAFRGAHPIIHRITNPVLMLTIGGALLGVLGVVGGPVTLFKGLDQMKQLTQDAAAYTPAGLALVALVKVVAMVIAATSGFRGGRIFPSVFIGVAIGLFASALVPAIPQSLAVACGVLGILLPVTRQGWLSLFMASIVVPDFGLLALLTVVMLPAWLLVTGKPLMQIEVERSAASG